MSGALDRVIAVIGTTFPFAGLAISLSDVEAVLRIISLIIGIMVGIASYQKLRRKSNKAED